MTAEPLETYGEHPLPSLLFWRPLLTIYRRFRWNSL